MHSVIALAFFSRPHISHRRGDRVQGMGKKCPPFIQFFIGGRSACFEYCFSID